MHKGSKVAEENVVCRAQNEEVEEERSDSQGDQVYELQGRAN